MNVDQIRRDSSALNVIVTRIKEAYQENPVIERTAALADYLAAVSHDTDTGDRIAVDAQLLRNGDINAIQRWSLWLGTIAENASKEEKHAD